MTWVIWLVVFTVVSVMVLEVVATLLYHRYVSAGNRAAMNTLLVKKKNSTMSTPYTLYETHPFTGWTLNPFYVNKLGQRIHNKLGFRAKTDFVEKTEALRIYCAGGSTTYCTDIDETDLTWPSLLEKKLQISLGRSVEVINGGVGGFNTYQSFIRLSAYLDYLHPQLVIVYLNKNDLTSFYNPPAHITKIFPDFSNAMRSLNFYEMGKNILAWTRYSALLKLLAAYQISLQQLNVLPYVYQLQTQPDVPRMLDWRLDLAVISTMQKNIIAVCASRKIPVLYVTEVVHDAVLAPYMAQIHQLVRELARSDQRCYAFDLAAIFPYEKELFIDKLHFTPKGCQKMADLLAAHLLSQSLVSPKER